MSIFGPVSKELNLNLNTISNVAHPTRPNDAATKEYVDSRPPIITIWAEESGALNKGKYEWSFGNGATSQHAGYTMMANGRILAISLTSVPVRSSDNSVKDINVGIVVNGKPIKGYEIELINGVSAVKIFQTPLAVKSGSVINFVSNSSTKDSAASVIALLVELNIKSSV